MSPILFNLFMDLKIRKLSSLPPSHTFSALFSFIDDIALQTACPKILHTTLSFLFKRRPDIRPLPQCDKIRIPRPQQCTSPHHPHLR